MCKLAKQCLCSSGRDGTKSHFSLIYSFSKLMTRENLLPEAICLGLFYGWITQKIGSEPQMCDHSPGPSLAVLPV